MTKRLLATIAVLVLAIVATPTGPVSARQVNRDSGAGQIGPGVQMITAGIRCTADFVFKDARGRTFVGYAASCARKSRTGRTGCTAKSRPLGTRVRFTSAGHTLGKGALRYSSWTAMRRSHTTSRSLCRTNNLALVQVDRRSQRLVDPTVPYWGGPTALGAIPAPGARVYTVGMSSARQRVATPKAGEVRRSTQRWSEIFTPLASQRMDAGAPYLDSRGHAIGILAGPALGSVGTNQVGGLVAEVRFARTHGMKGLRLVPGRTRFTQGAIL